MAVYNMSLILVRVAKSIPDLYIAHVQLVPYFPIGFAG